jgi:hypothetical protein
MREDLNVVEIDNEGLLVFLYDEKSRGEIERQDPEIVHGVIEPDSERLKALAGKLVVYELDQEDRIKLGVAVGDPLTTKEKRGLPWRKLQVTRLSLPSGKLCIESFDSLRLGGEAPACEGARLTVRPGDYTLTLQRVDVERLEGRYDGPREVIALTPARQKAVRSPVYLAFADAPRAPWAGRYKIDQGAFQGELIHAEPDGGFSLNLDAGAAGKLGIQRGAHLIIEHEGVRLDAYYQAGIDPEQWASALGPRLFLAARARYPKLLRAYLDRSRLTAEWARDPQNPYEEGGIYRGYWLLRVAPFEGAAAGLEPIRALKRGAQLVVRAEKPFAAPPDLSWQGRARLDGELVRAQVIDARHSSLQLNVGPELERLLRLKKGGVLELTVNGKKLIARQGRDGTDTSQLYFGYQPHIDVANQFFFTVDAKLSAKIGDAATLRKIK